MSAGSDLAGVIIAPTFSPMFDLDTVLFVVVGWLQYAILRSSATIALFASP
jgi:hypothetical protein